MGGVLRAKGYTIMDSRVGDYRIGIMMVDITAFVAGG